MQPLNASGYIFGQKRNFYNGQHVIISDLGDGQEYDGLIRGKGLDHVVDSYLVELSPSTKQRFKAKDPAWEWDCILLTEACLRVDDRHDAFGVDV